MVVYLQNIIVVKAVYVKFYTEIHVITYNFIEESDTHLGSAVASLPMAWFYVTLWLYMISGQEASPMGSRHGWVSINAIQGSH